MHSKPVEKSTSQKGQADSCLCEYPYPYAASTGEHSNFESGGPMGAHRDETSDEMEN